MCKFVSTMHFKRKFNKFLKEGINFAAAHNSKGLEFDTVILTNDFLTDNKLRERKSKMLYAKMLLNWFAGVMKRINPVFMAIMKNFK